MKCDNEALKFDHLYNNTIKDLFQYDFENNDINQRTKEKDDESNDFLLIIG